MHGVWRALISIFMAVNASEETAKYLPKEERRLIDKQNAFN